MSCDKTQRRCLLTKLNVRLPCDFFDGNGSPGVRERARLPRRGIPSKIKKNGFYAFWNKKKIKNTTNAIKTNNYCDRVSGAKRCRSWRRRRDSAMVAWRRGRRRLTGAARVVHSARRAWPTTTHTTATATTATTTTTRCARWADCRRTCRGQASRSASRRWPYCSPVSWPVRGSRPVNRTACPA